MITRVAVVEDGYVTNAQIFTADPAIINEDSDSSAWEDEYCELKNPCVFIGIFKGYNEGAIKRKAASVQGVHPDIITLINPDKPSSVIITE